MAVNTDTSSFPAAANTKSQAEDVLETHPKKLPAEKSVVKTVSERHSTHKFRPDKPVPREILTECLSLAQHAPSNNNLQPWRITICTGEPLLRLKATLVNAFKSQVPLQIPQVPEKYLHFQQQHGAMLYGPPGYNIAREDKEARFNAIVDNFNNYGAPCVAIVGIDKSLATSDIVSVGMYLQTLILLLSEQGLGTIPQVSIAGYPELIRKELDIAEDVTILCGLAIGFPDEASNLNTVRIPRDPWRNNVRFLD